MKVLFVCTGNTCRSPMAQFLAEDEAKKRGIEGEFRSAGIYALPGDPMSRAGVRALEKLMGRTVSHGALPMSKELFDAADLVVGMTEDHRSMLERQYGKSDKLIAMPESVGDPYGGSETTYLDSARRIREGIAGLMDKGIIR